METDGIDIGVVEGIVGIMRWDVIVEGMTNHAGTTPMDRRRGSEAGAADRRIMVLDSIPLTR